MTTELSEQQCRTRYEARLHDELRAISQAGDQTGADRRPVMLDQQSVGRLSRMDALQGQAMALAMQGRRDNRARAITTALERLASGAFGWCDECGEFIGVKRLDLAPTVLCCVGCAR
ncbi:TraR/DksA C4-type zinc finger protein [uncultured Roseobacter sp.]|uniref:TraR/DksA family transcriptional regulator n=1 Tax=uncultured Roseobacter sp. TaxID=114847 RepID=UPI00260A5D4F|nr:TraR/DksA C4-type zinc finger protein [uncultured Roseobacter sp.]